METWKKEIQDKYNLEILQKESGVFEAKGSLDAIISFEQHLENIYMNNPNIPDQEVANHHKKQEHMQPEKSEMKPDVLTATSAVQGKQVTEQTNSQEYMQKLDKEQKYKQGGTSKEMKENNSSCTSKCTLRINGLEIAVFEGDITCLPADCIVIYTNEVEEPLASAAGSYRQTNIGCGERRVETVCPS